MDIQRINDCVSQLQFLSFLLGFLCVILIVLISVFLIKKEKAKKIQEFQKSTGIDVNKLAQMFTAPASSVAINDAVDKISDKEI